MEECRVLCYSAGMDSYCLDRLFDYDEYVFFDVGTDENRHEFQMVTDHIDADKLHVINLEGLSSVEMGNKTIPLRNIIFAFLASNFGNVIHLGGTYGDRFNVRDGDEIAANLASGLLNHFNAFGYELDTMPQEHAEYRVEFPLCSFTKGEILRKTVENTDKTVESVLSETKTCHYGDSSRGCGECEDCLRRATAAGYTLDSPDDLDIVLEDHFGVNPFESYETDQELADTFSRRKREFEQFSEVYSDWIFYAGYQS